MKRRQAITKRFIELMKDNELRSLTERSIQKAAAINPDPNTNPASTLEKLYDFIDWATRCLPWNLLKEDNFPDLYTRIDQSINYIWFIFGQPLEELEGRDYYMPTLEFHEPIASWLKEYAKDWGHFLSTEESWNDDYFRMQFEDDRFGMNTGWYSKENIWKTYNEFFSRHLIDPSVRPIGKAAVVSPADSLIEGVWKIKDDGYVEDSVLIKSHKVYQVVDLLPEDSGYRDCFNGGTLTHTFLNVNDYHRYHFPVDGKILEMSKIDAFNAVGGETVFDKDSGHYICVCGDTSWQSRETRDCIVLDTAYGKVAVLPVGMSQICSCNFEEDLKVGDEVKKGDPLGYFLFGGSDIVMLFEKDVEFTLVAKPNKHILMGEDYAELKLK